MRYAIAFVFCNLAFLSFSQVVEYFQLITPTITISNSLYRTAHFIDSRKNTSNLGFVYSRKGLRKLLVIPERSFQKQFENLFANCCDSSTEKKDLIIQFRKFEFIDVRQMGPDYSFCELRIQLYEKKDSLISALAVLDTIVDLDIINKKKLFELTSEVITDFILQNLRLSPKIKSVLTYNDIVAIDSVEKSKLKLYSDPVYTDGLYKDFKSFKNQKPDFKLVNVVFSNNKAFRVIYKNEHGKPKALDPGTYYAFVFKEKSYIISTYGYYPLIKKDNDFFFTGEFNCIIEPSAGRLGARTIKNISETLNPGGTRLYEMMLDHFDGSLIQIKELN